jgi:hypothetical protein
MEKKFINQSFDKFAEKTTTKSVPNYVDLGQIGEYKFKIGLRHVKTPDLDSLLFDIVLNTKEWLFIRNGHLTIKADVDLFKLEAKENYSKVLGHQKIGDRYVDLGQEESTHYSINQGLLEKICEADKVEIRVSGESYCDFEGKTLENFKLMCKQFYNNFYDSSKYSSALEQKVKAAGSCFIATAAMGDYNHPVVVDLRLFRDNWLLKRTWGVNFTHWYYTHGPKAAKFIEKSTFMKKITFYTIVKPLQFLTKNLK